MEELQEKFHWRGIKLCCPDCGLVLVKRVDGFFCDKCRKIFPLIDDIPSFVEKNDFYESKWATPHIHDTSLLSRVSFLFSPAEQFFKKYLYTFAPPKPRLSGRGLWWRCSVCRPGAPGFSPGGLHSLREKAHHKISGKSEVTILDLGCAAGRTFYTTAGTVVGLDFSLGSLNKAKNIYALVVQADVLKLPFENETFDFVLSYDLIGHIPQEHKEEFIAQIYRVLKPGGRTIHYIETEGNNSLERFAKKYSELYGKYFIKQDGHIGLEKPSLIIERFRRHNFICVAKLKRSFTGLRFPREYLKRFDNEYKEKSFLIKILVNFCKVVTITKILEYPFKFIVSLCECLMRKFSPLDASSGICLALDKKKMHVCIVSGSYPPLKDGIGDYTFKLIEALNRYNIKVSLLTSADSQIIDYAKHHKENLYILPVIKSWNIHFLYTVLRLINRESFDVIHIQYPNIKYKKTLLFCLLPFLTRLLQERVKVITTLHEFSLAYPLNRIRQLVLAWFSSRVIVSDERDFQALTGFLGVNKVKLEIIPIGSNIDVYNYQPQQRKIFLKERGLSEQTFIILFFGNIHPEKGLEGLLEAFSGLIRKGFALYLVIISQLDATVNKYHDEIKRLASSLGIEKFIFFSGYIEAKEVSQLLSLSDICVLPFRDGATMRRGSLIAAIVHAKAIISTKLNGYVPSRLIDGENIILVPAKDAHKLKEAIKKVKEDAFLQQKLAEGTKKLTPDFCWENIAELHMALYNKVITK
jgi:glycosyltransferase involved in cell wall biosynthesis/SAM-dependent methyltransferase